MQISLNEGSHKLPFNETELTVSFQFIAEFFSKQEPHVLSERQQKCNCPAI